MAVIDNLKAYWSLEETSGTRADAHGSNDLTDVNTVTSTTGIQGTAASFDSANTESLEVSDPVDLRLGSDTSFTMAGWLRVPSAANTPVWAKASPFGGNQIEYLLRYDADNLRFRFFLQDGAVAHNHSVSLSSATWYFVIMWHDAAADTINVQVNNGTASSTSHTGGTTYYSGSLFALGRQAGSGGTFTGDLDEVGFWDRALTSDERTWLYNSGAGRSYADIVAEGSTGTATAFPRWRQVRR